jgi:hypothetical protein
VLFYFANNAGTATSNVRRSEIQNKINANEKIMLFLLSVIRVAASKGIAKHSLGTLDPRAAAAPQMTVSPITEFQDVSCLTAVRIAGSHAKTFVDKPKSLDATNSGVTVTVTRNLVAKLEGKLSIYCEVSF